MRQRAVGVLVATLVVAGLIGVAEAAPPKQAARANRALAIVNGDQLLNGLALPSGVTQVAKEPSGDDGALARSTTPLFYAAEVDRARFWVTAATPSAVLSAVIAHLPKDTTGGGCCTPGQDNFESWSPATVEPGRLGERLLDVQAMQLKDGKTGVRADAWVQYIAPRPYAQRVPGQARILEVTVSRRPNPIKPRVVTTTREVTNAATVRRIAAVVDGLPFIGGPDVEISCPSIGGPGQSFDTLRFRAHPGGRVLATVSAWSLTSDTADPCAPTGLWIRGHGEPALADGGVLLKAVGLK
jgi:hypothetical protein